MEANPKNALPKQARGRSSRTFLRQPGSLPGVISLAAGIAGFSVVPVTDVNSVDAHACRLPTTIRDSGAPGLAKPGYLSTITDPVFGTRITRISGDPGTPVRGIAGERWGAVVRHRYSKDQAWNADESLLVLQRNEGSRLGQALFLDGRTYEPLFARPLPSDSELRWHPRDPGSMLFARGDTFGTWDVRGGLQSILRRFPGYAELRIGPYEGNLSLDGQNIVFTARDPTGEVVIFLYDLATGTKHADIRLKSVTQSLDWASVSASGRYLVVNDEEDRTVVLDRAGAIVARFAEYGRPSHFDLTLDPSGEDIAVGVSKSPPDTGLVIARRLRDGHVTVLTKVGFASHSSVRNRAAPDRIFADFEWSQDGRDYDGEIVMSSLSRRAVYRIARHRNLVRDYLSESHASPSVAGDRVVFASNWGAPDGRPVQAYVADFRSLCASGDQTQKP